MLFRVSSVPLAIGFGPTSIPVATALIAAAFAARLGGGALARPAAHRAYWALGFACFAAGAAAEAYGASYGWSPVTFRIYYLAGGVLAVGAPFGLAGSVTHGIVSAKGRAGLHINMYEDFLQTDAAINPGNSGGPLISLEGKVIGINAAIKSKNGGFQGVGLAVASNLAKSIVTGLRTDGTIKRGYLGIQVRELDAEVAARLGVPKDSTGVGRAFGSTWTANPAPGAWPRPRRSRARPPIDRASAAGTAKSPSGR